MKYPIKIKRGYVNIVTDHVYLVDNDDTPLVNALECKGNIYPDIDDDVAKRICLCLNFCKDLTNEELYEKST